MPPRHRLILTLLIPLTAVGIMLLSVLWAQGAPTASDDMFLAGSVYLSAGHIQWLQLIAFAPLFVALAFMWRIEQPEPDFFQPELLGAFGIWISLANGYVAAYLLALTKVLPNFEPALQSLNDPRLPAMPLNYLAIAFVSGTVIFYIWFIFFRRRGFGRLADRIVLPHRRSALLVLLTVLVVVVWGLGEVNFALLLVPPAWLWILIEPRSSRVGKTLNALLALGGVAAFGIMFLLLPNGLNAWHLILAAVYGIFFPLDVLAFLLLTALFSRFLRLGLASPSAERSPSHALSHGDTRPTPPSPDPL